MNRDALNRNPSGNDGFTSRMTRGETAAALIYLPLHVWLLPTLLVSLPAAGGLSDLGLNVAVYIFGTVYMLVFLGRFLRRDFDPLCDHPGTCILQILTCYGMMIAFNLILSGILTLILPADSSNPNNSAVMEMAGLEYGKTAALAIFLAPLVEEPVFRGAIFGSLRSRNRILAYAVSMLLFALYHVWGYALQDPVYWIFLLQYLPVSWLLCRCYERCNSIWGNIFFHMLVNAVSISALNALSDLLA